MATVEPNASPPPSEAQSPPVDPVFSAEDDRRERVLRVVGRLVAVVVGVWLLALLAGAMGFGHLPRLPGSSLLDRAVNRPSKAPAETPSANPTAGGNQNLAARTVARGAKRRVESPSARRRTSGQPKPPAARQPPSARQVPPPVTLPPSPGRPRGRAVRRHGVQPPPAPPPGNANGNGNGNANGQAVLNPGRAKHALPPPPPPPPPPKKP